MKNIILFGAGKRGLDALKRYGREKVAFFCDNDIKKQGTYMQDVLVISFDDMCKYHKKGFLIVITPHNHWVMAGQLELEGIYDYAVFRDKCVLHLDGLKQSEEDNAAINKFLDKYVEECGKIDLLVDTNQFRDLVKELFANKPQNNILLGHIGIKGGESAYYGNLEDLLEYAGLTDDFDAVFAPHVSHYDSCPRFFPLFTSLNATVFSGYYYGRQMHIRFPYMPVFVVGPYIHYSRSIYDDKKIMELKKQYGRTLLVYLPHSIEKVERKFNKEAFIDEVIKLYGKEFDTLLLCVYWADMLDPICEYAGNKGIKVVSNGFRFDNKFNRRQKSLMQIADALVCGDIGTHLGYALYMGLPVGRVNMSDSTALNMLECKGDIERKLQFGEIYQQFSSLFMELYDERLQMNSEQKKWMEPYQTFSKIRSNSYIRNMFMICEDVWKECGGQMNYYPESVFRMLRKYEEYDLDKYIILKEALTSF